MKTIYKISLGVMCVGFFLGATVVQAATVDMMRIFVAGTVNTNGADVQHININHGQSVTVIWKAPDHFAYCNTGVSPSMPSGWGSYVDLPLSGTYTVTPTAPMRFQMQCAYTKGGPMIDEDAVAVDFNTTSGGGGTGACNSNADCGSPVNGSNVCSNNSIYKNVTTPTCVNPGTSTSSCQNVASQQFVNNCNASQTCSGGACVNNSNTGTITCSTDSQCGSSGYTGNPSCSSGNVFQNYLSYTGACKNPGTTSSYCASPTSTYQQVTACSGATTCSNGACTTNGGGGNSNLVVSCNASPSSIQVNQSTTFSASVSGGTGIYSYAWQGACQAGSQNCSATFSQSGNYTASLTVTSGSQSTTASCSVGVSGSNNNNNYCTYHSYQSCSSGSVHWYDSCGVDQGISQACNGNQTCSGNTCVNQNINYNNNNTYYGNVYVTTQVRNLSSGNLNWSTSVSASPSDILQYQVTIQNNSGTNLNNVTVRDTLPTNLFYDNNLMVDGISNSGNITYGVNIGSLASGQTRTVTYQVQVGGAQNFVFGTTTLTDSVSVTSSNGNAQNSSAFVTVNRSGVLGATSVSTGLTNNPIVDSFFLPLILALLGVWAYKAGLLNILVKNRQASVNAKLMNKIAAIKESEVR